MENEIVKQIKKEDKKQAGKYIGVLAICGLGGGVVGAVTALLEDMNMLSLLPQMIENAIYTISPYVGLIIGVVSALIYSFLYRKSRKLYHSWDGEAEDIINTIEKKLSIALTIVGLNQIIFLIFMAIGFQYMKLAADAPKNVLVFRVIFMVVGYILNLFFVILGHQKIINFEKEMNPEKQGSVFDTKFQKKWLNSCDEAEQLIIYQAAFTSYKATNMTCATLWMCCLLGMLVWDFGVFPVILVGIIWLASLLSYSIKAMVLTAKNN